MFKFLAKRRQREVMIKRYLINQYMCSLSDEQFDQFIDLGKTSPEAQRECARMENLAFEVGRRLGRERLEQIMDDYYSRLEAEGELKRDVPAYEEYFKYVDLCK